MGKKVLPRVVAETRVQAMQLKLFIEISVLQKHEKTQIQSGGQRGLLREHPREEPEEKEAQEKSTKRRLEDKKARVEVPAVRGSLGLHLRDGCGGSFPPHPTSPQ